MLLWLILIFDNRDMGKFISRIIQLFEKITIPI